MAVVDILEYINGLNEALSIADGDKTIVTQSGEVKKLNLDLIIRQYLTIKNVFCDATLYDTIVDLADYVGFTDVQVWKTDVSVNGVYISDSRGYQIDGEDTKILTVPGSGVHLILNPSDNVWYISTGTAQGTTAVILVDAGTGDMNFTLSEGADMVIVKSDSTEHTITILPSPSFSFATGVSPVLSLQWESVRIVPSGSVLYAEGSSDVYATPSPFYVLQGSLATAVVNLTATGGTIYINTRVHVTDNLTIPANITLKIEIPGMLVISSDKTLSINGSFSAGLYQCFDCIGSPPGRVAGLTTQYPEWFDQSGNGNPRVTLSVYANNATAIAAGLLVGQLYRSGGDPDVVSIVH